MICSNCFNGCADIVSDKCVKYTGIDIPGLGITTGDPLLVVENQIISKILTLMTGEGIIPIIDPTDLCAIVSNYLPISGDITLNHVISALIQSICELEIRLADTETALNVLEADYIIGCLSGVSVSDGTHAILQATISKLCTVSTNLDTLSAELIANYVLIDDINDYIAAYIADQPVSTLYNSKMIPYTAVPYFGPTAGFFDISGAGLGNWEKIYLCNGQNLTPDLRGRGLVGNTTMGSTAFDPAVDPALPGNPTYSQDTVVGANLAVLTDIGQIPLHTHTADILIVDPGHAHSFGGSIAVRGGSGPEAFSDTDNLDTHDILQTEFSFTGINAAVTVHPAGGSSPDGHNNIQPVHSTNYIIYIP